MDVKTFIDNIESVTDSKYKDIKDEIYNFFNKKIIIDNPIVEIITDKDF